MSLSEENRSDLQWIVDMGDLMARGQLTGRGVGRAIKMRAKSILAAREQGRTPPGEGEPQEAARRSGEKLGDWITGQIAEAARAPVQPAVDGDRRERLARWIESLDSAAMPTKSEVFVVCGREAAEMRDDLRALIADDPAPRSGGLEQAIREACDLLAERSYGSPARSPAHNARLLLEGALASPQPVQARGGSGR